MFKNNKNLIIVLLIVITPLIITGKGIKAYNKTSDRIGANISLCTNPGGVFDHSYNEGTWVAMKEIGKELDLDVNYYTPKEDKTSNYISIMNTAAKGNPDMIIATSFTQSEAVGVEQRKHPDIKYVTIDTSPVDENGNADIADNTVAVFFSEHESGFLAGYSSVMDGFRNLGFIGGMAIPSVKKFGYGFAYGANQAAKDLGLYPGDVRIKYTYTGSFSPSPEMMALAVSWYSADTEVIFSCAGMAATSVIKAAEQLDKKVIGVDSDMSAVSDVIITSALKDVGSAVKSIIRDYAEGKLEPGIKNFSAKEHGVGLPMETSRFRTFSQKEYEELLSHLAAEEYEMDTEALSVEDLGLEFVDCKMY